MKGMIFMRKLLILFLLAFLLVPSNIAEAKSTVKVDIKKLSPHDAVSYFIKNKEDKMVLTIDGKVYGLLKDADKKFFKNWLEKFKNDKANKYGIYPIDYAKLYGNVEYAYMEEVIERALKDRRNRKCYSNRLDAHYFDNLIMNEVTYEKGEIIDDVSYGYSSLRFNSEEAFDDYMNALSKDFRNQSDAVKVEVVFNYYARQSKYNKKKMYNDTCNVRRLASGKKVEGVCHHFAVFSQELCGFLSKDIDAKYLLYDIKKIGLQHADTRIAAKNSDGEYEYSIISNGNYKNTQYFLPDYKCLSKKDQKAEKKAKKYIEENKQITEFENELVKRMLSNVDKEAFEKDENDSWEEYINRNTWDNEYRNKKVRVTWSIKNKNKEKYGFDNLSGEYQNYSDNDFEEDEYEEYSDYEEYTEEEDYVEYTEEEEYGSYNDYIDYEGLYV